MSPFLTSKSPSASDRHRFSAALRGLRCCAGRLGRGAGAAPSSAAGGTAAGEGAAGDGKGAAGGDGDVTWRQDDQKGTPKYPKSDFDIDFHGLGLYSMILDDLYCSVEILEKNILVCSL